MPVFNQIIQQQGQGALGPLALQQIGSVFDEEISVPTALQEALIAKGLTVPPPERGRALIDTGATFSAVENTIMTRLGVPPVGITSVGTAGGRHMANQYPAKFTLTLGNGSISFEIPRATGAEYDGPALYRIDWTEPARECGHDIQRWFGNNHSRNLDLSHHPLFQGHEHRAA